MGLTKAQRFSLATPHFSCFREFSLHQPDAFMMFSKRFRGF